MYKLQGHGHTLYYLFLPPCHVECYKHSRSLIKNFWMLITDFRPSSKLTLLRLSIKGNLTQDLRRRQWQPTPVLLPGKSHGQRSLVGCSPWGHKESDTTERLHVHFSLFTFMHWRRKWQSTPVFVPGEAQGQGSLVGFRLWGCTELDTTEAT